MSKNMFTKKNLCSNLVHLVLMFLFLSSIGGKVEIQEELYAKECEGLLRGELNDEEKRQNLRKLIQKAPSGDALSSCLLKTTTWNGLSYKDEETLAELKKNHQVFFEILNEIDSKSFKIHLGDFSNITILSNYVVEKYSSYFRGYYLKGYDCLNRNDFIKAREYFYKSLLLSNHFTSMFFAKNNVRAISLAVSDLEYKRKDYKESVDMFETAFRNSLSKPIGHYPYTAYNALNSYLHLGDENSLCMAKELWLTLESPLIIIKYQDIPISDYIVDRHKIQNLYEKVEAHQKNQHIFKDNKFCRDKVKKSNNCSMKTAIDSDGPLDKTIFNSCSNEWQKIVFSNLTLSQKLDEWKKFEKICAKHQLYEVLVAQMSAIYGHYEKQKKVFRSLRDTSLWNSLLEITEYQAEIRKGNFDNLTNIAKQRMIDCPTSSIGYRLKAYDYINSKNLQEAEKYLLKSLILFSYNLDEQKDTLALQDQYFAASDLYYQKCDYYNATTFYRLALSQNSGLKTESLVLMNPYTSCNAIESFLKLGTKCDICYAKKILSYQKSVDNEIEKSPAYHKVKKIYEETVSEPENRIIEEDSQYCESVMKECSVITKPLE